MEVRMIKKNGEGLASFTVSPDLTESQAIQYAKDVYKERKGKRAYGFTYKVTN